MAAGNAAWVAATNGEITPATAGTAKTFLNVIAAAGKSFKVTELGIGFIGVSAAAKPVLVELCQSTQAGAGSGSSAVTVIAATSPTDTQTVQSTAAKGYTSEPTVLTTIREWLVHPQSSLVVQFPLGREPCSGVADGIALRVTFATAETLANGRCYIEFEE